MSDPISVTLIPPPKNLIDAEKIRAYHGGLQDMYQYILDTQTKTGFPPSYRQIVAHFNGNYTGMTSTCGVHTRIRLLEKYGFIQFAPNGKTWRAIP